MKVTAIVPAAGIGKRIKKGVKKPFLILGDKPIIVHTLSRLQHSPYINNIILVVNKADLNRIRKLVEGFRLNKVVKIVSGGKSRFESVWRGLAFVDNRTDLVFIHDGVRPFLNSSTISKTIKEAYSCGGAVAGIPATSTIKFVKKEKAVDYTPDRTKLWIIGTPQVFKRDLILKAYRKARDLSKKRFDDSMLAEQLGAKIKVVLDSYENIKITTPLDLLLGEAILKKSKVKSKK